MRIMNNKLFVGNLSYKVTETDLSELFAQYGEVTSTVVPKDRETGRPRGFAFVEMVSQEAAESAIRALDGTQFEGRDLKVGVSTPKPRASAGRY